MCADCRYLGEIIMPVGFVVAEFGPDPVPGIHRDEFDVEYVVEYPLIKGGG